MTTYSHGGQRVMRRLGIALAVVAGGYAASAALAQDTQPAPPAPANSANPLNIPTDPTIFAERDPTIRKPTAIINGEIITQTDVDLRLALVVAANDIEIAPEERRQLEMQVLRNLIDETLQIQEAAANEITIAPAEIDQAFLRVAERSNLPPDRFEQYLLSRGTSPATMKRQIHGELAWQRLLSRYASVEISEAQVQAIVDVLNATRGQTEYRVAEIWMDVTPSNEAEVAATARRIIEQLRQGASFTAYARQYSQATTAGVGGDLGWVFPAQLPSPLDEAIAQIPVGAISEPIPNSGGVSIIAVADRRSVLTSDPRDATLSLKQITVTFPPGSTQAEATPMVERLAAATRGGGGCGRAEEVAASFGGDVVQNDEIRMRDLPPSLQEAMINLQVGEASPPFGSVEDGVRVLIICGREDPAAIAQPDPRQIEEGLFQEAQNRRAQRYMRDLRRDAVIEYR